jgi:serine/threonine protein kinase
VDHVKAERNVLAEVHNPYVVKLLYSFQVGGPCVLHAQRPVSVDAIRCRLVCGIVQYVCPHHGPSVLQDDEYLYLIMEYLPGGDVMVRCAQPAAAL